MKVLILGAGASRAAGYPLASELMTTIERDAVDSKNLQLADAWKGWLSIKNAAPPELRILLSHPNPEVTLSLLDLCLICFKDGLVEKFREDNRQEAVTEALSRNEIREDLYLSTAHAWLDKAGTAVFRLVDSLSEYLEFKQHADIESASSRGYLRDLFSGLSKDDVVITLNWDASADRSLFEINRWSPRDGYGFEKRLVSAGCGAASTRPTAPNGSLRVRSAHVDHGRQKKWVIFCAYFAIVIVWSPLAVARSVVFRVVRANEAFDNRRL